MSICCSTMPDQGVREGSFFSSSQSICPTCRKTIQGKIIFIDQKVYLVKKCLEHGEFRALISSDMEYWVNSLTYTKPGSIPYSFSTKVDKGCPDDCGLCEDHEQHTCTPIIEISNKCDLKCPICIVWNQNTYNMSFDEFTGIVDNLLEKEGELETMYLSGGEPTLHPDFLKFAEYATSKKEVKRVIISSHGLKLARDEEFAKKFKELGLYLSLQFDSLKAENYEAIRGENLLEEKYKCLEMCEKYNIPTLIVPTVAKGFNEDEVGDIVNLAFSYDFVTSIVFQPAAFTGAGGSNFPNDPLDKITMPCMHKYLAEQVDWLKRDHFKPIPCSHPSCYSVTYMLKTAKNEFVPLTEFADVSKYLDAITNSGLFDADAKTQELIQDAIYKLWSAQAMTVDSEKVTNALKDILKKYESTVDNGTKELQHYGEAKMKAIFIHAFMDEHDFEVSRVRKCCTHYALPDGRIMPGCPYNNVHRFEDKRLDIPTQK